ncbi:sodium/potassium/calcium exchanger 4-like [Anthonomus grandis grandis]|uniref:sodium/potassium/calcium exchanger 4-like n=1 Tax=Anthonomus grandis grandis TaxID=2921223 RepID=UPI0021664046|nr:sodium/potassium/calcium exchanger 4-like [Anthonomus grandis grandis]
MAVKWGFGFLLVVIGCIVSVYAQGNQEYVSKMTPTNSSDGEVSAVHISDLLYSQSINPFGMSLDNKNYENLLETTTKSSDDDEFPPFLTPEQQRNGGVVLCFIVAIYCFTLLAIVCDKYFIPSIERLCEVLDIPADVGAATFMSVATSCPELFTNIIATFITGSELGIGTIVGSSMFNSLGVASIGSLAAIRPIKLDWWPVTRDVFIYIVAISVLIGIVWDARIYWYEALVLFILYFVYFIVMFQNTRISRFVRRQVDRFQNRSAVDVISSENGKDKEFREKEFSRDSVRASVASAFGTYAEEARRSAYEHPDDYKKQRQVQEEQEINSIKKSPFIIPEGGWFVKFMFFYTWPIKMALRCTLPNPKIHPKLWSITFLMCIIWIGANSYMVSWMVSIIGDVFNIPSTVQGMTFMAAGGSLPESISIAIMARRGEGKMGVSNSLGANTMNILFSLGMPWFFKTMTMGINNDSFIGIESGSIVYTIMSLILVGLILYVTLIFNKFTLSKVTGCILVVVYIICIVLACLSEMVFFKS